MATLDPDGHPLDDRNRQIRFRLPDPVLALKPRKRFVGLWMSEDDPNRAVMMQHPKAGAFVRALLPVQLTDGYTITFGVWVAVSPEDLQHAFEAWWAPEYIDLSLTGTLANTINPWGLHGAPVDLTVRDADTTPYCDASTDPVLQRVLDGRWPHAEVLNATQG